MGLKFTVTAAALTLVLFGTGAQADPEQWTILAPEFATSVTHQCSREAPAEGSDGVKSALDSCYK